MSTVLLGAKPGGNLESVAQSVGPGITSNPVELQVNMATTVVTDNGTTRQIQREEVLLLLNLFEQYITRMNWPYVAS